MSGLGSWLWGQSQIDEAIDKATSELLPAGSEDIALNLEICDQIRSKSVQAKDAMRSLKRRLNHKNPNVQLLTLQLTDICVKNGGDHFLVEIASREFQDNLVSILKMPALNWDVKQMILRLIQNWGIAFEARPTASYVTQVYKSLQREGFDFPPKDLAATSAAMVSTETAPEWIDSDVCLRCRTPFSFTNRKHHCRNCGQVFDQQCSSKSLPLPHYGITVDVRVCDGCYNKLGKKGDKIDNVKPHTPRSPYSRHDGHSRSGRSLADEELQRAIELSLQEANAGATSSSAPSSYNPRPGYAPSYAYQAVGGQPPSVNRDARPNGKSLEEQEEEQLKAAIEASLKETNPQSSAPLNGPSEPRYSSGTPMPSAPMPYDLSPQESDAILSFSQSLDSPHPGAVGLYSQANSLRPKLASSLEDTQRKEAMLSGMNDKISEVVRLYEQKMTMQAQALAQAQDQIRWAQQQQQQYPNAQPQPQWQNPAQQQPYGQQPYWAQQQAAAPQATSPPPQAQTPSGQYYQPQAQPSTPYQQQAAYGQQPQQAYPGYQQPQATGSSYQQPQSTGPSYSQPQAYAPPQTSAPASQPYPEPSQTPHPAQPQQPTGVYPYGQGAQPTQAQPQAPPQNAYQAPPQQVQSPGASQVSHEALAQYQQPTAPYAQQGQYAPPAQATAPPVSTPSAPPPEPIQSPPPSTGYYQPPQANGQYTQSSYPQQTPAQQYASAPAPEPVQSPPPPQQQQPQFSPSIPTQQPSQQYSAAHQTYQLPSSASVTQPLDGASLNRSHTISVPQQQQTAPIADQAGAGLARSSTVSGHGGEPNKYAALQALQAQLVSPPPAAAQAQQSPFGGAPQQQQPQSVPPQQQHAPPQQQQPQYAPPQQHYQQAPPQASVQPALFPTAPTSAPQAFQAINGLAPPSAAPYGGIYGSEGPRKSDAALIEF